MYPGPNRGPYREIPINKPFFGGYLWVSDLQQSLENMINTVRVHC